MENMASHLIVALRKSRCNPYRLAEGVDQNGIKTLPVRKKETTRYDSNL